MISGVLRRLGLGGEFVAAQTEPRQTVLRMFMYCSSALIQSSGGLKRTIIKVTFLNLGRS